MQFETTCNLKKITPSGAEDASYRVSRSHLNQKVSPGYEIGDVFEYVFSSNSGLWLKDKDGLTVFVPIGEVQCFNEMD
jgi:hypothetical protein